MAIENLPRPWFLAALAGLKVSELLEQPEQEGVERLPKRAPRRTEVKRRRLRATCTETRSGSGGGERRLS